MPRGFDILLEDDALLAVDKPCGIATQAPPQFDSLEARIRRYLTGAERDPAGIYLGIPHRLDRPVSGAMLFAKTRRAARALARQFERRQVKKLYWALVERTLEAPEGTWHDYLRKIYGQPKTMIVSATDPAGQEAVLRYRTLGYHGGGAWLEIELETGRTHQIRVQAASRGHAVLGDVMYGAQLSYGVEPGDEREREIALLARRIEFLHPTTKAPLAVEAAPSATWQAIALTPRES